MPETRMIALSGITAAKHRLRTLREDTVNALVQSMADQGQLQPIVVRPRKEDGYWLVAGLHRLESAKKLKWKEINCTIFDDMEANEAELAEIDENLIRADLSPAERALQTGKRKELYETVYPETKATKAGGPGRAKTRRQNGDDIAERFTKDTAKKSSTPERTVQRDATRAKNVPVLLDIIGTSLDKGAEIDALAKLPVEKQRSLAEAAKRGEKVSAIAAPSAHDPGDPKMSGGTEKIELAFQDLDRLATFKRRTLDPEAVWVCQQLELAWYALRRGVGEAAKVGVVDRAVAGEKVSAAKTQRTANIGNRHEDPGAEDPEPGYMPEDAVPLSVRIAASVAAIPAPAIGPQQIKACSAASLRKDSEVIARHTAHQRDWQAREARAAQDELKREIERRRAGGR
jgi:hypothetical protein